MLLSSVLISFRTSRVLGRRLRPVHLNLAPRNDNDTPHCDPPREPSPKNRTALAEEIGACQEPELDAYLAALTERATCRSPSPRLEDPRLIPNATIALANSLT